MIWREWIPKHQPGGPRAIRMVKNLVHKGIHVEITIRNDGSCKSLIGDGSYLEVRHWTDWVEAKEHALAALGAADYRPDKKYRAF